MMLWYGRSMDHWRRQALRQHFSIIRGVFNANEVTRLTTVISQAQRQQPPGQSGFCIAHIPLLELLLRPVTAGVRRWSGRKLYLHLDKSSCRTQEPNNKAALALHQDIAALGAGAADSCVVWLPLCEIDAETPSLQVCLWEPDIPLVHVSDAVGYSVLLQSSHLPMVAIQDMKIGDALIFTGYTIHGTHIPPGASKTRRSLDLRFLPVNP